MKSYSTNIDVIELAPYWIYYVLVDQQRREMTKSIIFFFASSKTALETPISNIRVRIAELEMNTQTFAYGSLEIVFRMLLVINQIDRRKIMLKKIKK